MFDVRDVDFDFPVPNIVVDICRVVQDTERTRDPKRWCPGFEFLGLGVLVEAIQRHDIPCQDLPEAVDDPSSYGCVVEEPPHKAEAVVGTPDAGAEPHQEAHSYQVVESLLEGRDMYWCHPDRAVTGFTDDPVDWNALGSIGVGRVVGGFSAAVDDDVGVSFRGCGL